MYKRGIVVEEKKTSFPQPELTRYGVQVVIGTSAVNLADNPYTITNVPLKISSFDEGVRIFGYSNDWDSYTLEQSMYASFQIFNIYPVIFINVLDPKKHVKENPEKEYPVTEHQVVLDEIGILKDSLEVVPFDAEDGSKYDHNKDFVLSFKTDGKIMITMLSSGGGYEAARIKVISKSIDPAKVTESDIIGAINMETGAESGLETIRQIYPRHGIVPGMLLSPGWSHKPNVGAALMGKCEGISGTFRTECLLDIDTGMTKKYSECAAVKRQLGYTDKHAIVLWPKVTADSKVFYYSAIYGALTSFHTAANEDVPYLYPSNKALHIDGAVLDNGMKVLLDQTQAGELNGEGIVTILNDNQYKSYGNNTGCYPDNTDPKDRWIGCRRMFSFVSNYFVLAYKERLDGNMNRRTIDDIVNNFNIWGNSLMAEGMCANLKMEFLEEENTTEDIMSGHLKVRIYLAPYTPVEYIQAALEFDVTALQSVMAAEE